MTTYDDRYAGLINAMVAAAFTRQVQDQIADGYGPPDLDTSKRMMEEAFAIADLGQEAIMEMKREEDEEKAAEQDRLAQKGDRSRPVC